MPRNLANAKSTLIQVMARCIQTASHHLNHCRPKSLSPHGEIELVNSGILTKMNLLTPSMPPVVRYCPARSRVELRVHFIVIISHTCYSSNPLLRKSKVAEWNSMPNMMWIWLKIFIDGTWMGNKNWSDSDTPSSSLLYCNLWHFFMEKYEFYMTMTVTMLTQRKTSMMKTYYTKLQITNDTTKNICQICHPHARRGKTVFIFTPHGLIFCLQWASCQIAKIACAHAPGMPGTFSPTPRVRDPDMHHGTCVSTCREACRDR